MSSQTTQSAARGAEINSLNARLAAAKSNRATKIEALSRLKTRHANQYTMLLDFRDEVEQKDREAQLAYSSNQLREYRYKREEINNIGLQRVRTMREWGELGCQIQEASEELRVLDQEISHIEQILEAYKAL